MQPWQSPFLSLGLSMHICRVVGPDDSSIAPIWGALVSVLLGFIPNNMPSTEAQCSQSPPAQLPCYPKPVLPNGRDGTLHSSVPASCCLGNVLCLLGALGAPALLTMHLFCPLFPLPS